MPVADVHEGLQGAVELEPAQLLNQGVAHVSGGLGVSNHQINFFSFGHLELLPVPLDEPAGSGDLPMW
jgi:hypothetical protein